MKVIVSLAILVMLAVPVWAADAPATVTLSAKDMLLADAVKQISTQTGASIVVDPKAQGKVTASLNSADLSQALDVVSKTNGLSWKKLQFARPAEDKIQLEQLKTTAMVLATMPMVGLSVEDPTAKTSAVFAKDLPTAPDLSSIKLPEGYTWTTVYVVLAPEAPKAVTAAGKDTSLASLSQSTLQQTMELAKLTSDQRKQIYQNEWMAQLSLAPEVRQAMLRDRMQAMFGLDQQYRDQLRQDMRGAFHGMGGDNGGRRDGGSRERRDRGSRDANRQ